MGELVLEDVTIHWDTTGEGEPIVLIAGCGQPAMAWHLGLVPQLVDAGYQVVTFDNRGVDLSSSPPAPYSIEQMSGDAIALFEHLGFEDGVRVAGHSLGGWIAETIALTDPRWLRSVAFMGSLNAPSAWEKAITTVERDLSRDFPDLPALYYATETLRYLPIAQIQDDDVIGGWLAVIGDLPPWPNPGRLGQYEACLAWSTDSARTRGWETLDTPSLVVAFEHDVDSPPAKARAAAATLPNAEYVEIASAGHLGIMTHGDQVAAALVDFFGRN